MSFLTYRQIQINRCYGSSLGSNADISQKYKMCDINKGLANTLVCQKIYKKIFKKRDGIKVRQNVELSVISAYFLLVQLGHKEGGGRYQWGPRLESWLNTAAHLTGQRRVTQQGVILFVMDGPCCMPDLRNHTPCLGMGLIY